MSKETPEPLENDANYRRRQQLITFGHNQWGFKNWNWSVTKQELDFVDYTNGKYCAGVVAFVSIKVHSLGLHREDVGYATTLASHKGSAIYNARKASVTNALRETFLGFGGNIATQLLEQLEQYKSENDTSSAEKKLNNENANENENGFTSDTKNMFNNSSPSQRKDSSDSSISSENHNKVKSPQRFGNNIQHSGKNIAEKQHQSIRPHQAEMPNFPANQALVKPNSGFVTNNNPKVIPPVAQVPPPSALVPGNVRPNNNGPPMSGPPPIQHPSNVADDDELRAERLRRQKQKMEEFKIKQMQKNNSNAL